MVDPQSNDVLMARILHFWGVVNRRNLDKWTW